MSVAPSFSDRGRNHAFQKVGARQQRVVDVADRLFVSLVPQQRHLVHRVLHFAEKSLGSRAEVIADEALRVLEVPAHDCAFFLSSAMSDSSSAADFATTCMELTSSEAY